LLFRSIAIYNKQLIDRSIDAVVWIATTLIIAEYVMPLFGINDKQYGTFILIGNFAIWGLFEMLTSVGIFLGDIQGDKSISYYMSLPLPSYIIFIEQSFASAYRSMTSSILILPIGKLILGTDFIISTINWPKFIFACFMINIFYGFFTIFLASYCDNLSNLTMIRSRIIFPLWFLGCFQFQWGMLYKVLPFLAYIDLGNPLTFILEGIRSSTLGPEKYLPFWICMGMLIFFSILFGYLGIQKLKQRLDCI
jgi:ABC-type polysaccharide/polyol phosphate export permease